MPLLFTCDTASKGVEQCWALNYCLLVLVKLVFVVDLLSEVTTLLQASLDIHFISQIIHSCIPSSQPLVFFQ